jgi:RiboL-PSP-HEPN
MHNSLNLFKFNIAEARNLTALYDYLEVSMKSPLSFDDLLRSQIVYSVSAFDKLIHDIIRIGMVEIFVGRRSPTPAYLAESIAISTHNELISATIPPPAYIFEQAIFRKLKIISYQEPSKIAEGLSYIWEEKQKWQKISAEIGLSDKDVKTQLKLIANRRNTIVHESDIDISSNSKYPIDKNDCKAITDFLEQCGEAIVKLII